MKTFVKGEHTIDAGMPESFNVLVKEIRSFGIDIDHVSATDMRSHLSSEILFKQNSR